MQRTREHSESQSRAAYVKTVDVADLPEEMQKGGKGRSHLYALHDAEGKQLAVVAERHMAFVLARQNDYVPVPVH
ncbi:DUF1150 family protein [Parasedimentitalea psychrophila]|uniref:DUF1150 family protein n=1 Tax=Parasedimentitalea psychrophila TaxID=2997337 RepID=A0A9Y2KVR5_9RHOB|nr:DUF1150 family protein [Parasedimentitalea psychrophila]WIY23423.1 DUF1150 family protein [Parasedimentitalea psychrophila]